jgi:hypothetical protein
VRTRSDRARPGVSASQASANATILQTLPHFSPNRKELLDMKNLKLAEIVLAVSCAIVVDADDDGTCAATMPWTTRASAADNQWYGVTFGTISDNNRHRNNRQHPCNFFPRYFSLFFYNLD